MPADSVPSNNSSIDENAIENMFGTSPGAASLRTRTESENSGSFNGSPPKVITLDEFENITQNFQKIELVHEIVFNPEFLLKPYEPPENSLESRFKEILHKAFWDILREDLQKTPPCYDSAIKLLKEIKEGFHEVLPAQNKRGLEQINETLDEELIRQQAEQGVLDFKAYADFIIQLMAKYCAPARDEAVAKLSEITDVVDTFKSILDIMKLMKMDLANFLMSSARNTIIAHSVEYEKKKFNEYLEYYKFGFPATENWLKRNCIQNANGTPMTLDQTLWNAYMELMDWDEANEFPELLNIDKQRFLKLGQRAKRLCVCASLNAILSGIPIISQRNENRISLAKELQILLQDVTNDKEIREAIPNVWEQIKSKVNEFLIKEGQPVMDESVENPLGAQILQLANKDAPVRLLMWKRLQAFYRLVTRTRDGIPPPPPGFVEYKEELEAYVTALKLVTSYNHNVFGEYFMQIITAQKMPRNSEAASTSATATVGAALSQKNEQEE